MSIHLNILLQLHAVQAGWQGFSGDWLSPAQMENLCTVCGVDLIEAWNSVEPVNRRFGKDGKFPGGRWYCKKHEEESIEELEKRLKACKERYSWKFYNRDFGVTSEEERMKDLRYKTLHAWHGKDRFNLDVSFGRDSKQEQFDRREDARRMEYFAQMKARKK